MKTQTTTQQFKTPETEQEQGGLTMAPPQFKFADSSDARQRGSERTNQEASAMEDAGNAGYTERVSNFAVVTKKILEWGQNQDDGKLFSALESLKHDAKEVAQFQAYFQSKVGKSLIAYLGQWFSPETAANILDNGFIGAQGVSAIDLADLIHQKIGDGDPDRIASSLLGIPKPSEVAAAYQEAYQSDLKTDLLASAPEGSALAEMVHNVFGDTQNFEKVKVNNEAEATEARAIIARIYDVYGVDVNSQKMLDIARNYYKDTPQEIQDLLKTETWRLADLKELETALGHFGAITGANRATSTRAAGAQSVTTVGRMNQHVEKEADGSFKTGGASGAFFPPNDAVAIYNSAETKNNSGKKEVVKGANGLPEKDYAGKPKMKEVDNSMAFVLTHELGHGFLEYAEPEFKKTMKYWQQEGGVGLTKRKVSKPEGEFFEVEACKTEVEAPPTSYGASGYKEDLAESVGLYFIDAARMRRGTDWFQKLAENYQRPSIVGGPCLERMAFIQKKIASWKAIAPAQK